MNRTRTPTLLGSILNAPPLTWVLTGFAVSYLLFFVRPVFLSAPAMQFFRYVPIIEPIGVDLRSMLSYSASWFVHQQSPYIGDNLYPPLAAVLFTPLLVVDSSLAYKIMTLVTVFCYGMIAFAFPLWSGQERRVSPLLMLVFISGLFSYGFQFELERGQFNLIAVLFAFMGIYVFHYHNRHRTLAYVLISIAIQLKLFPAIFIVMLIRDWHDWGHNLRRLLTLLAVNFAMLFVLGVHAFVDFVRAVTGQVVSPYVWVGNHSIASFVSLGPYPAPGPIRLILLSFVVLCILSIVVQTYRQAPQGISPYLLFACAVGALLIPSVSHDYTLPILTAPMAILFGNNELFKRIHGMGRCLMSVVLVLIISVAYSSTLISYTNKPVLVENNFLALATMLLAVTFLCLLTGPISNGRELNQYELR